MSTKAGHRLEVSAHRGARQEAPENTLEALRACAVMGVDRVELDVRQSLDGVLYDFHDARLGRTTDGRGLFRMRSSRYIDALDAGSWFDESFAGARVPRVEAVFAEFGDSMGFYLDVKPGVSVRRLVRLIARYGVGKRTFVSFIGMPRARQRFARIAPEVRIKQGGNTFEALERGLPPEVSIVECGAENLNTEYVELARRRGLEVVGRCHEDNTDHYQRVLDLGVDHVNADNPRAFMEYLRGDTKR